MVLVQAFDRMFNPMGEPVSVDNVQGMAWGVRDDIKNGKRGMIANQCTSSVSIHWWIVTEA